MCFIPAEAQTALDSALEHYLTRKLPFSSMNIKLRAGRIAESDVEITQEMASKALRLRFLTFTFPQGWVAVPIVDRGFIVYSFLAIAENPSSFADIVVQKEKEKWEKNADEKQNIRSRAKDFVNKYWRQLIGAW